MGPGSKLLHFVLLTDIFIRYFIFLLGATIETSSMHVNNDSSTDPLIMGTFEERAPGPINQVYGSPLICGIIRVK